MENTNQTNALKGGDENPVNRTSEEIKKELNSILLNGCGYWGQKLDALYETLNQYKKNGTAKLIAEYLLLEEDN